MATATSPLRIKNPKVETEITEREKMHAIIVEAIIACNQRNY